MSAESAVTLRQLRALSAIARSGSMAAAGREIGLSTPAIHSQIKGLEEALGHDLVQRSVEHSGMTLTAGGQVLLDATARIEAVLSQAVTRIRAIGTGQEGRVEIGVVSTAKYFAPRLVKILRNVHPGIEVALHVGNREDILRHLDMVRFDMTIMGRPPRMPPVEAVPIGPHPHGIIAPADHLLAGRAGLTFADLAGETFIAREEGSGTRILMMRYLDRIGEGATFTHVEMGSNETIKQAVIAGLGIAFLSLHTVADELRNGSLVLLATPQLPILRRWFLVEPMGINRTPAAKAVAATILGLQGAFLPDVPGQHPA